MPKKLPSNIIHCKIPLFYFHMLLSMLTLRLRAQSVALCGIAQDGTFVFILVFRVCIKLSFQTHGKLFLSY